MCTVKASQFERCRGKRFNLRYLFIYFKIHFEIIVLVIAIFISTIPDIVAFSELDIIRPRLFWGAGIPNSNNFSTVNMPSGGGSNRSHIFTLNKY